MHHTSPLLLFFALALPLSSSGAPLAILEAEAGNLDANSNFAAPITDFSATSFAYTETTADAAGNSPTSADDVIRYNVDLDAGTYDLYARIFVGTGAAEDDSFFIGSDFGARTPGADADWVVIDGLSSDFMDVDGNAVTLSSYTWVNLGAQQTYTSPGGIQTFDIGGRENGLRLDAFVFSPQGTALSSSELDDFFFLDTDEDLLFDGAELSGSDNSGRPSGFGPTDPANPDSDNDNFGDASELRFGSNPNDIDNLPGTIVPFVNGSFEDPILPAATAVSGGTIPGWVVNVNDMYITAGFPAGTAESPDAPAAGNGSQFATADRTAPDPDIDSSSLENGDSATMSIQQDIDLTSFASLIDTGDQTFYLEFDFYNDTRPFGGPDGGDTLTVTVQFLDASGQQLASLPALFLGLTGASEWRTSSGENFPPVGSRTARVSVSSGLAFGGGTVRNTHVDNFRATLAKIDTDSDGIPDGWEEFYQLDPTDPSDAAISSDEDTLTNLQEFQNRTNPTNNDSDGDTFDDDVEIAAGFDPNDDQSFPDPPPAEVIVNNIEFNAANELEITFEGLNPNATYSLRRGTDLVDFADLVETRQAGSTNATFTDTTPPAGRAFYRLELQP